jgi:hypothetical protein
VQYTITAPLLLAIAATQQRRKVQRSYIMAMSSLDKRNVVAPTRIGDAEAAQPVSGLDHIDATKAVHGMGRGAYVREDETKKKPH